jgi:hypothetical protein
MLNDLSTLTLLTLSTINIDLQFLRFVAASAWKTSVLLDAVSASDTESRAGLDLRHAAVP